MTRQLRADHRAWGDRRAWGARQPGRRRRVWACGVATAAAVLALELALAVAVRAQGRLVLAPGPASVDEVVGTLAAAAALLLGTWLAVSSSAAVLAHAPGRVGARAERLAAAWAPLLTRRIAAVLVGATVGGTLAPGTALAHEAAPFPGFSASAHGSTPENSPGFQVSTPDPSRTVESLPGAGWTPARPVQRPLASASLVTSGAAPGPGGEVGEIVVHRGDTLWQLAAAHLGPDATDAEVTEAWPRWHAANRAVIGDDPDRLLPGQVLRVPTPVVSR